MNSIVSNHGSNEVPKVSLGNGELVSMKIVQEIYAELTGKEESLDNQYNVNHEVGYDDLYQLNAKIFQLTEQYNIIASNCSITIYHQNNQRQNFSSFERFSIYDKSVPSPTDRIIIEYSFLILLPQSQKPQSYKITISLGSRAAHIKTLKKESRFKNHIFFEMLSDVTGESEIRFIDYSVARNFQITIKDWFDSLESNQERKIINILKRSKHHFASIISTIAVVIFAVSTAYYFSRQAESFGDSVKFITLTVVGSLLINKIFVDVGHYMAIAISRIFPVSLIKLTKGDESLAKEVRQDNNLNFLKFILAPAVSVALNILSTWLCVKLAIG
ncbi:hypothetical protein [Paracidovorax oryzae]|uniref:hypothetical protein n=1 Tax=Paracidovorax oryzae TaxID=862720 RepID=UPI0035CF4955